MKKCLLSFLFFGIFSAGLSGQNKYEKGYFVDNKGNKNEGLIKNLDWKNNPNQFEFKTSESSKTELFKINNVSSFGIENKVKYIRSKTKIDNSSNFIGSLSSAKEPEYTEQEVFLKQVVEGNNNLYEYTSSSTKLFFYQIKGGELTPLVYKKYLIEENKVAENNEYKKQLKEVKGCSDVAGNDNIAIRYTTKELTDFFTKANSCDGGSVNYYNIETSQKKKLFHVSIKPGVNFSSYSIEHAMMPDFYNVDFGSKTGFRIGAEAEFVLPFNNNKIAIVLEPNYQYFKSEKTIDASTNRGVKVKYSSLEIPVGARYYMFLDHKSKIFLNAFCVFDAVLGGSKVEYDYTFASPSFQSSMNFAFGAGYKYADRYSVEFRAYTKRNMLPGGTGMTSGYNNLSIILGYTLF